MTEILVVIAIIAVLASILFTMIPRIREKSDNTKCMGNLRQMGSLIGIYMSENNGLLPYSAGYNHTGTGANSFGWDHHASPLAVLAEIGEGRTRRDWFDQPGDQHIFNCPSECSSFRTYTANAHLMGFLPGGGRRVPYSVINRPGAKILIVDSRKSPTRVGNGWLRDVAEIGDRHNGLGNALFADFHVESVNRSQLTVNDNLKK